MSLRPAYRRHQTRAQIPMPPSSDREQPGFAAGGSSASEPVSNQSPSDPQPQNSNRDSSPANIAVKEEPSDRDQEGGSPPSPPGGGSGNDDNEPPDMGKMSFLDHLEELRRRIFHSLFGILGGFLICWTFADELYEGLALPLTQILRELNLADQLVYTNPTAPFNLYIKLAALAGVFVASPFLLYQVWKFISPGLYPKEKRYAVPFVLFCSLLFISGGVFAYMVAFPAALRFLLNFASQFQPFITVNEYFKLAVTIILGLAIVFELPILIVFLTLLRVMTPQFLLRNFRYAVLLICILAAAITPTPDVLTMSLFALPLIALYFLGIGLSHLVLWNRKRNED